MASFMAIMIPRAAVWAERISEVLDSEPPRAPRRTRCTIPRARDRRVPRRRASPTRARSIRCSTGITFRAEPGETVAVVGSTGAGKTTLISLIPRLFDVTGGEVLGRRRRRARGRPRRRSGTSIGLVPQRPFLFTGTIASNLRFGREDATDDELWRALEIAQGRDFVEEMEGRLDARIAQGGTNVSGGQRQRLAIARAIVHNPRARVRRLVLGARPHHRCPTTAGALAGVARGDEDRGRPAHLDDHGRRPHRGARRRPRWSASERTRSSSRASRPTGRSSSRSSEWRPRRTTHRDRPPRSPCSPPTSSSSSNSAEQARINSGDWDSVAPGKAKNFGQSFGRLLGLLKPHAFAFALRVAARRHRRRADGHRTEGARRGDQHHLRGRRLEQSRSLPRRHHARARSSRRCEPPGRTTSPTSSPR